MILIPVALFARVSSDRQDVDLSVSAQLRALRDYAEKNGYIVVREYVDEAESGRVADRPEFRKMIDAASKAESPFREIPGKAVGNGRGAQPRHRTRLGLLELELASRDGQVASPTTGSIHVNWACTYRIANFSVGSPDIRSRLGYIGLAYTGLQTTMKGHSHTNADGRAWPHDPTLRLSSLHFVLDA